MNAPAAPTPVMFQGMDITFSTGGDDKNPDTRLEIFVVRVNGEPAVAYLDVRGQGFAENTSQGFNVPATLPVARDVINTYQISVKISPNGNDTWDFSFSAVLRFGDGSTGRLDVPATSLSQDNKQGFYALAGMAITPAPTSAQGRVA